MNPPTLSVVVWAHRNAEDLAACLATLGFADRRVVVVARDRTDLIRCAEDLNAGTVEENPDISGFPTEWVLSLGDDMRISPSLAGIIGQTMNDGGADIHDVPVRHRFAGRTVRFGLTEELSPIQKPRLQRTKGKGRHGRPLPEPADRHFGTDISDFLRNLDHHTTVKARSLAGSARREHLGAAKRAVWRGFVKSFFGGGGFREGRIGLVIAIGTALSPILTYLKAASETVPVEEKTA